MRWLGCLLAWFLVAVLLYELFLYGLRRYEQENGGDVPRSELGLIDVALRFALEVLALAGFLLARPLGRLWPFEAPSARGARPVVLIHGYSMTRASLYVLAWRFRRAGYGPIYGVGYRTWFADLGTGVHRLAATVDRARRETGAVAIDVVAHSLGGLVTRLALRDPAVSHGVRKLVTLATPHAGTKVGAVAWESNARELRPGSALFRKLEEQGPIPPGVEVTSIFSPFDATVLPTRSAYLPGAASVEVDGIGHNTMLLSAKIFTLVREALEAEPA